MIIRFERFQYIGVVIILTLHGIVVSGQVKNDSTKNKFPSPGIIADTTQNIFPDSTQSNLADSTIKGTDSLRYPIYDRRGDKLSTVNRNPFDLKDPANKKDSMGYDPKTKSYFINEKIGNNYFRKPSEYDQYDLIKMKSREWENSYFRDRANTISLLNRRLQKPQLRAHEGLFDRLFGKGKIDIKPQGEVNFIAGYMGQNVKNPTLPERARKNGGFDFDMNANLNVLGNIGEKLKMPISYNTQSNFDFENQLKMDYTGGPDDIFKKIEIGNTSFASKGTLIPGAQQLFGVKTQMQFGKLWVSTIFANQRSQRQSMKLQGGTSNQQFQLKASAYEENRHFLVGQYFRNNYNEALSNLPIIRSQIQILRMEVWVTNRTGTTTETRDVVGLMDLGESEPYKQSVIQSNGGKYPSNNSNDLYSNILANPTSRDPANVISNITGLGLQGVQDFEKTYARKLDSTQYTFHRQLGFLSLNIALQPDEVLAVAYQYTVNGKVFQVGEFSQDVPVDSSSGVQRILFLKLLKATSPRTKLPIWDLMMKNIYSVGYGMLERQDFKFNILYEEPGGGEKRYLPEGDQAGVPILTLLNLDRLNNQNDPQPDGVFDYVEGYTVISPVSRIIFPVLEPFGKDLEFAFKDPELRKKYLYYPLYDTIRAIAQTYANLDRYIFRGTAKSAGGSGNGDIPLNAFNVPPGSVTVTAGGQTLKENVDYTIDYVSGSIKIINESIKTSGMPINVNYENNATFGVQQRTYVGARWDYIFNDKLSVGGTWVRLSERPFFTKMEYGQDPIRNTMLGFDANYQNELPRLTKWLGKLPFYKPQGNSTISAFGEVANLKPGHAPQIGKGADGLVYVDDFEGTKASIDLRFPIISWNLASTPKGAKNTLGEVMFPEADKFNDLSYGMNRAKLAWYNIEPTLQERRNSNNPLRENIDELSDPRVRAISQQEIFPQRTPDFGQNQLVTFDLAYYPKERGPYNYDVTNIDATGKLTDPQKRWGGIMRNIDQTDFETANIEFIEFWMLDPFIKNTNPKGGTFYINLGNISEDILKDSRRFYENGLKTPTIPSATQPTVWGLAPLNPVQVTQAFSNDPADRPYQDVGLDGIPDSAEQRIRKADYLDQLAARIGTASDAYKKALEDPSADNFKYYRDASFDQEKTGILGRYKNFNNTQGNSPVAEANAQFASAFTMYPDGEDFNRDNSLNENEEYFQYRVKIEPNMQVGTNYIADKKEVDVTLANGLKEKQYWYQFRIPISQYTDKVGDIPDFKSIRFVRLFMTDFEDSTVLRFAKFEMVRNNWRSFTYELDTSSKYIPVVADNASMFNVSAVNIEENDRRVPIPYRVPPGIQRVQALSNGGINILQNEQAMSLAFTNLKKGLNNAKAVFKNVNLDLRQYKKLSMFLHAESKVSSTSVKDGELYAVFRIGNDFISNFYEIRYPLKMTPWNTTDEEVIWPKENRMELDLRSLVNLKAARNAANASVSQIFSSIDEASGKKLSIVGNPNMGEVRGILVGIENGSSSSETLDAEVWVNELRLSGIDENDAWAAVGQLNLQLADLGSLSVAGSMHTTGFGALEQRVNERFREDLKQIDIATNLQLGKLLPKTWGLEIPFFASYSQMSMAPQYDPYDKDILLKDKLRVFRDKRDSIRRDAEDFTSIKTINFTNVRKAPGKKIKLWSISNFDFSYAFSQTLQRSPLIELNDLKRHQGGVGYTYSGKPKYFEPFKKLIKTKSRTLDFIKNLNVNYIPNLLNARFDGRRQFGAIRPRNVGGGPYKIPETYDKYFVFDRLYNMRWDLTRSLNIDFKALNNSRIDEPIGRIDTRPKKDSILSNVFKGGRNTLYTQSMDINYNLPTNILPFLDWTTVSLNYRTTYNWIGASRLAISLGNTIQNSYAKGATAELNLTQLYNKWRILRSLGQPTAQKLQPNQNNSQNKGGKEKEEKGPIELTGIAKSFAGIVTAVKRVGITYNEGASTILPGYIDSTRFLGQNLRSMQPGLGFVFGVQPDQNWLNNASKKGLITKDPVLNNLFRQTYDQRFNVSASVEPFRDFNIDVNLEKTLSKTYSSLFKDTTGFGDFVNLSPYAAGGFSISFISYKTMFSKLDPNNISETFKTFQDYRRVLSERLGNANPYSKVQRSDGYYNGYGRYAQDVLIPAFLAAYTGKDPNTISLLKTGNGDFVKANPFAGYLPKPNWRVTFNGLSRLPMFEKVFTNFSITHGYNSTLSMNSFNSALLFQDTLMLGFPSFLDTISGNYIPFFLIPNVTISEQFGPLVGIDFTTTNQFSGRFEYRKSRQLSLSLIDYQLSEVRSTEITLSSRYRLRGFTLPFIKSDVSNDMTFAIDLSIRDDINSNSRLDQTNAIATGGQKVISIRPTIDYVISNRVNLQFYFDQRRVTPYISSSAPMTNTRAGLQVRVSLAQ